MAAWTKLDLDQIISNCNIQQANKSLPWAHGGAHFWLLTVRHWFWVCGPGMRWCGLILKIAGSSASSRPRTQTLRPGGAVGIQVHGRGQEWRRGGSGRVGRNVRFGSRHAHFWLAYPPCSRRPSRSAAPVRPTCRAYLTRKGFPRGRGVAVSLPRALMEDRVAQLAASLDAVAAPFGLKRMETLGEDGSGAQNFYAVRLRRTGGRNAPWPCAPSQRRCRCPRSVAGT
jgi:hypothetical protein